MFVHSLCHLIVRRGEERFRGAVCGSGILQDTSCINVSTQRIEQELIGGELLVWHDFLYNDSFLHERSTARINPASEIAV